jgi:hypothetical protein
MACYRDSFTFFDKKESVAYFARKSQFTVCIVSMRRERIYATFAWGPLFRVFHLGELEGNGRAA